MQTYEGVKAEVEDILKNNKIYIHTYINTLNPDFITDEIILMCINAGVTNMLCFIKNQTENICIKAIQNDAREFLSVQKQTKRVCEHTALHCKSNQGYLLGAVINQTDFICEIFIKNDPGAIAFVRNQTHKLCDLAISKDPLTLKYVRDQTTDVCINGVANYPFVIRYVRKITNKIKEHYKLAMSKL